MRLDVNSTGKMDVNVNTAHVYHHVSVELVPGLSGGANGSPVIFGGVFLIALLLLLGRKKA